MHENRSQGQRIDYDKQTHDKGNVNAGLKLNVLT